MPTYLSSYDFVNLSKLYRKDNVMMFGQALILYSKQLRVKEHCWCCWGKKFIFSPNHVDSIGGGGGVGS
jgi:hypothetical protein